jgi:hypothetical protein
MQKSVTQSSVCIPTHGLIGFAIMFFMKNITKHHHFLGLGLCLWGLLFGAISTSMAQDVTSDLLGRINNLRASLGLSPYSLNGALSVAANAHARWMTDNNAVSHTQYDGSTPRDRAQAAGYSSQWVSENIYMGGIATVDNAWNFWINSAVHYAGLTNIHYNDIGIGTATGVGGQAFVLVFGNSTGAWQSASPSVANNNSSGTGSAQNAPPPLPIVGVDAVGNIMYEVQAGDDLGTIALLFGYTWDDIPAMLALNEMSEDDMRTLKVGSVFLVPPASGTYTPTPLPTQDPLIPTTTATFTPEPPTNTPTVTFTSTALPPAVYVRPSETPTMPLLIRTLPPSTSVAMVSTPILKTADVSPTNSTQPPIWLWVALVVQVGILGAALIEFFRRRR